MRYDNEAGKGDHCHVGEKEQAYLFSTPQRLIADFLADIERWNDEQCGVGPVSIREASRRVERDVKAVHRDVTALLAAGLVLKNEQGLVEFPYEAVKVEFLLEAA